MGRKTLGLKLQDKIPCSEIRKRAKITDIVEYTLKQKVKKGRTYSKMKDNMWTKRCTESQPRRGKRSRGRPSRGWHDYIARKEETTWNRKATGNGRHWWRATSCSGWTKPRWKVKQSNRQKAMEDIDGGLHPAVDGQSPGERWNKATDRRQWKTLIEGYILQWMDKTQVRWSEWAGPSSLRCGWAMVKYKVGKEVWDGRCGWYHWYPMADRLFMVNMIAIVCNAFFCINSIPRGINLRMQVYMDGYMGGWMDGRTK